MELEILGTRGEVQPTTPFHSKHSGILVDKKILLDFGEKDFLTKKPKWILLTHLHPDHAVFVRNKINEDLPILLGPERHEKAKIRVRVKPFFLDDYKITPIPTHHSKLVKSQAYRIDFGKKSILYTGDIIWIDKKYHHLLQKLNLVITEGSYFKNKGLIRRDQKTGKIFGHNGVPNLVDLFKPFTKKMILVHFGSWFLKDVKKAKEKIKKLSQKKNMQILIGYDGMKLSI